MIIKFEKEINISTISGVSKVNEALFSLESKSKERTFVDASYIEEKAKNMIIRLHDKYGIPNNLLSKGTGLYISLDEKMPRSYRYKNNYSSAYVTFRNKKFYVSYVCRDYNFPTSQDKSYVNLNQESKDWLIRNIVESAESISW